MKSNWQSVTLGDLARNVAQYRPYLIAVMAVVLLVVVLPGDPPQGETTFAGNNDFGNGNNDFGNGTTDGGTSGTDGFASGDGGTTTGGGGGTTVTTGAGGTGGTSGGNGSGGTSGGNGSGGTSGGDGSGGTPGDDGGTPQPTGQPHPNCDPATGRMKVPMMDAAGCVGNFPEGADNGGATYRGVSDDKIIVAIRQSEADPAATAVVNAAGVDDEPEQVRATRQAYMDMYEHHYEFYGREVEFVYFDASGEDDQADRADAVKVANEIGAFASLGGSGAYKDELVARGVMCISCTASEPVETYLNDAPFVWSTLMASTQAYMHRMVYACRLWGGEAQHAGDPTLQLERRKLGIIYYETESGSYGKGVDFAEQQFAELCGGGFTDRISYLFDLAQAQEQARTVIARLKDRGVTSVMFAGDFIYPIFFTQEATRQNYFPEWIITGSVLTDTNVFARTYDQTQWANAFGVSMLTVGVPQEQGVAYRVHQWHWGTSPEADDTYAVIHSPVWLLATGLHHAGPNLNPGTYQQGMFSWPPIGSGLSVQAASFGQHGIWPWDDYLRYDDMTEIWWDPNAVGEDEVGNQGRGMYQYVHGGQRYLPTEWPSGAPEVFDPSISTTGYDELPEADRPPEYPCNGCPSQQQQQEG